MENREQGSAMQSSESASKPTVSNTRRRTIDDERRWVTNNLSFFRKFTLTQPKLAPDLCYLSSGDIWIITFSHIFCIADRERVSERANKAAKAAKTLLFGSSEGREICFFLSLSFSSPDDTSPIRQAERSLRLIQAPMMINGSSPSSSSSSSSAAPRWNPNPRSEQRRTGSGSNKWLK